MLPLNPARIPQLYAEALRLQSAGKADEAAAIHRQILTANPRVAEAHFQLGRIAMSRGDPAAAAADFARAAEVKPREPAIWTAWADALAAGQDADAGKAMLDRARAARLDKRLVLELQRKLSPTSGTRASVGSVAPKALHEVVARLRRGDFAGAESRVTALIAAHPGIAALHDMLAAAQAGRGKPDAAEANHRKAVALDPRYAEAHANFGRFLVERGRPDEGLAELRKALKLAPKLVAAHSHLAVALERMGRAEAAAEAARRALALDPEQVEARLVLARARLDQDAPAEALAALKPLLRRAPVPLHARLVEAEALARLDQPEAAAAAFDAAIAAAPETARPLAEKARLMQRLGRFEEAENLFRAAIALEPADGRPYHVFMASHRATAGDPLIADMTRRWEDPDIGDESRMYFGFALSKAMEDIGAHDRVFTYLRPANALARAAHPFDLDALKRDHDALIAVFEDTDFGARAVADAPGYAPIFVTGLPRSGTTLVESILAAHSTVTGGGELGHARAAAARLVFPPGGTPRRLSDIPDAEVAAAGRAVEAAMRARFPDAERVTDKSVQSYNYLGLIGLALPRAALVVVERDPRDTLLSMYRNLFAPGQHTHAYDLGDLAAYWREYRRIMRFWRRKAPGRFHAIRYEALVAEPEAEARALVAACGLDWEDGCLAFHETRRRVDTLSLHQVRQPIYASSMKAWERYAAEIAPLLEALDEIEAEEAGQ